MSPRQASSPINDALVLSGVCEIALGALAGWPYSLAIANPERAQSLGIRSAHRMRQWHLDLIALGGLSVLAGNAVPDLPRHVALPLGLGAWTNANAFGVLTFRPEMRDHPAYRGAVGASFASVSFGWVATCALLVRRRRARSRS